MSIQWLGNPVKVYPSASSPLAITPSGSVWANSAWFELLPSTPVAWILCGLVVNPQGTVTGGESVEFEYEVGVGGSGSEVPIATTHGYSNLRTAPGEFARCPILIPVDAIPAGSRVAIRVRQSSTTTSRNYTAVIYYVEKPFSGTMQTTAKPQKCLPTAAGNLLVSASSTTAWANGSYVQFSAALPTDIVITGFTNGASGGGNFVSQCEVDVAIGGAGSEVVQFTVRFQKMENLGCPYYQPLALAVDLFPTGQRVAIRMRNGCTALLPVQNRLGLLYHEKPL